ncbi:MAG: hypothetical protein ACJ79S_18290 [Gemmatimonadaceae bacterium]
MPSAAPPHQPYGPNTDAVRRLLQRLAAAPVDEWERAARIYEGLARTGRFSAAERALAATVTAAGRERERDAVVGPVVQIAADAARRGAGAATGERKSADEPTDRFAEPALAAALAVIVRDLLSPDDFETLYSAVSWAVPVREIGG